MYKKKKPKIGRWILLVLIIFFWYKFLFPSNFTLKKTFTIKEGDTFQTFLSDFSSRQRLAIKRYVKRNDVDFSKLQMGSYIFSWEYSPKSFVQIIKDWPSVSYHTIKILEWRSIYDIDSSLSNKWLISTGEYIAFANDQTIISKYKQRYDFLQLAGAIKSLEWFLYPDTYKVDSERNIIDQLIYLQLETFKKRVWEKTKDITPPQGLDRYKTIILASIVEKEERSNKNRPTVAGILLKRLQLGTLIGADISLCYFYGMPYSSCTPNFIARNVSDQNNPYNTRTVKWLPPTPVSNPTTDSIIATLQPTQTDYFFYLHDNSWIIRYAKTLEQHNANKRKYLQ